jgi:mannitol-1-/sugar-/sorbitol-6-phosphatase
MTPVTCIALLIDMDGVLVDSTPAVARVWQRWALRHNLDAEPIIKRAHGRTSLTTIREVIPHATPETHEAENRWMEDAEIEDIADVVALPGAQQLLTAVPPSQSCVVTSATYKLAEVRLRRAGLWDYLQNIVTSSDITRGKPDPEPYLKGAERVHAPPQGCIVIEDAPSGTQSGKVAGCRVIALRTTTPDGELRAAGADWIVNDCASLRVTSQAVPWPGLSIELLEDPATARRVPKMS